MDHNKKKKDEEYQRKLKRVQNLLRRYFEGTLEETTQEKVEKWNPEEIPEKYELTDEMADEGTRRLTESLYAQLGFDPNEEEVRTTTPRPKSIPWRRYAAAAAIFGFILLGAGYLFTTHNGSLLLAEASAEKQTELFADGAILTTLLPDGTSIHINRGSKVRYNDGEFNKEKREIWLEGEAFFDVAKNPEKQFIIHSGSLTTVVKGTSFNVKVYPELMEMTVSVRTGKVEVRNESAILAQLTPNQQLLYDRGDGESHLLIADWQDAAAWMQGKLILKDAPIDELLLRIHQLYGVKVSLQGEILKGQRVTIAFGEGAAFRQVMDAVCALYEVQYIEKEVGEGIITARQ